MKGSEVIYRRHKVKRARIAPEIVQFYREGKGHKTIAKREGMSPSAVRRLLIEYGAWEPGSIKRTGTPKGLTRKLSPIRQKLRAFREARKEIASSHNALRDAWIAKRDTLRDTCPKRQAIRKAKVAARAKERYQGEIEHRLTCLLRRRIRKVITSAYKSGGALDLLGCTAQEFRTHIENSFELGMTWKNYGLWHLDHKRPCASFDLTDPAQQRICFHYSNYRPLWSRDNARKNSWWNGVLHRKRRVIGGHR